MFVEKGTITYCLSVGIAGFTWALLGMGIDVDSAKASSSLVPSGGEFSLTGEELSCPHLTPAVDQTETGMVVVWTRIGDIIGRFLGPDSTLSAPFLVTEREEDSPGLQLRTPKVTVLADSRFAVAWIRKSSTYDEDVQVAFFDSEGTVETSELQVARAGEVGDLAMAPLPNGEVLIAWTEREPADRFSSLRFRIVRQDGSFAGAETVVAKSVRGDVDLASPREGEFFLIWNFQDPQGDRDRRGIRGKAFFGDGMPASEVLEVAPAEEGRWLGVAVEDLAGGGYLLGWAGTRSTGGIYVRLWSPVEGLKPVRRISDLPGLASPRLVETRDHVAVGYEKNTYRHNSYLRLLDKQGMPVSAEVVAAETRGSIWLDLVSDSAGQVLVLWQVYLGSVIIPTDCEIGHDIRGRYFSTGTAVPAIPTLGGAGLVLCGLAAFFCGVVFLRRRRHGA